MLSIRELHCRNVVVGSGAAGFSAALRLYQYGQTDTLLLTENISSGTSRNTGSDKQTYYKLSLSGSSGDSVGAMAKDLFAGGCVDGDHALCEAALSARCFYRLTELGVPFPDNEFGEFIGYQTDHDLRLRASSAGPYTSKMMTQCLEQEAAEKGIKILDRCQAIRLLTHENEAKGILCLCESNEKPEYLLIWCQNIILATGGPAGMYHDSVYPISQIGASGMAFEAGILGKNLTEWQFGMASLKPRWNVSGSYMQVLPRFVSTAPDGTDEQEFLAAFFSDPADYLNLTFLKGYQWPFDTAKIFGGSSLLDLLVYWETVLKGRKVFLDFTRNPGGGQLDFSVLSEEARNYLSSANCCFGTPIQRLLQLNAPAVAFYADHGVDLSKDLLPIAVCAQHNNGGLWVDGNWQTNVRGIYAAGEVAGTHGIVRPGGSALNAGQAGACRAAEHIAYSSAPRPITEEDRTTIRNDVDSFISMVKLSEEDNLDELWNLASRNMSSFGGMIRNEAQIEAALADISGCLSNFDQKAKITSVSRLGKFYRLRDMLISQKAYLSAMLDYISHGAKSRGSALYTDPHGILPAPGLPDLFRCCLDNNAHAGVIQELQFSFEQCSPNWRPVRPIPEPDYFFENQWQAFRARRSL